MRHLFFFYGYLCNQFPGILPSALCNALEERLFTEWLKENTPTCSYLRNSGKLFLWRIARLHGGKKKKHLNQNVAALVFTIGNRGITDQLTTFSKVVRGFSFNLTNLCKIWRSLNTGWNLHVLCFIQCLQDSSL